MLKEGLESVGPYNVTIVTNGTAALDVLVQDQIDLAIVDMGLEDMDGSALVQSLRQSKPDLCIMVIPLFGQELTEEEQSLEIQGVLPKPFYMDDLAALIWRAMTGDSAEEQDEATSTAPEAASRSRPEPPVAPRRAGRKKRATRDVNGLLQDLFEEVRAEAVLFVRGPDLIAHSGNVTQERAQELAGLAVESINAACKIAAFLGETDDRFEQCAFEGDEYSVYSTNVTSDTILAVALSARTPVGIVRYNLRRTADELAEVWYE